MTRIIDYAAPLGQKAGPGKWNDLDMLEVCFMIIAVSSMFTDMQHRSGMEEWTMMNIVRTSQSIS